jgi:hypothetical protein
VLYAKYLRAECEKLDIDYRAIGHPHLNGADLGEHCERLFADLLERYLAGVYDIFRGGVVVGLKGLPSRQVDIVLTAKNALRVFGDKGLYPIESVFGVVSVTSTMTARKFESSIEEFPRLPRGALGLQPFKFGLDGQKAAAYCAELLSTRATTIPYKCIFAFDGDLKTDWATELQDRVASNHTAEAELPDLVVVNKKGMILKVPEGKTKSGRKHLPYFQLFEFSQTGRFFYPLAFMLNKLFVLSQFQHRCVPRYDLYLGQDFAEFQSNK